LSHWWGNLSDLTSLVRLAVSALCNSVVVVASYLAIASLVWGAADALLPAPYDYKSFHEGPIAGRAWRLVHLFHIHVVGERYGFRVESKRSGARGNAKFLKVLALLEQIHKENPLDVILISGDMTDAGRSAEWAEFFDAIALYPQLAEHLLLLPNHDLNVVDRANPRPARPSDESKDAPASDKDAFSARETAGLQSLPRGHR
jgi:hypothetical protein